MTIYSFRNVAIAGGAAVLSARNLLNRYYDNVKGTDRFSKHTLEQHKMHPFSGMHSPFIPTLEQKNFVLQKFPKQAHLLPTSLEAFQAQQALQTSVKVESLSKCPMPFNSRKAQVVVVGGPPALVSTAFEWNVTYINATQKHSIWEGSALHLEWDAESEAPTTYLPSQFMADQVYRAFSYESLSLAEETGRFSWRSLDWAGWLKHPGYWVEGIRVALAFQKVAAASSDPNHRAAVLKDVADRTKANERFYQQLDKELNGQLLSSQSGSIIVARTPEEREALFAMKSGLEQEGRGLNVLTEEQMQARYGFVPPNGIAFAEKPHDKVLSPNFMQMLADRVDRLGGKTISGTLATIYVDNPFIGGVAHYKTPEGNNRYVPFSRLVLSLGNQRIIDRNGCPLFDIVAARGVSVVALAHVPKGRELPPVTVCGGTNHVTKLAGPVEVQGLDVYMLRMTAGACITPNVSEENSADYDATAATGLISAARETLGCELEVINVYGCNRQFNEFGQSHWVSLKPPNSPKPMSPLTPRGHELDMGTSRFPHSERGVFIQMGAGGGGLTLAPAQPAYSEE